MITLSTFTPRSTRLTFIRLFVNSPAETSSAIDSAICAVASRRSRQQQVRDVRARDDEDERRYAEQEPQRRSCGVRDGALPARARFEEDRFGLEACERLRAHPGLQRGFDVVDDRAILRIERCSGLVDRHARLSRPNTYKK